MTEKVIPRDFVYTGLQYTTPNIISNYNYLNDLSGNNISPTQNRSEFTLNSPNFMKIKSIRFTMSTSFSGGGTYCRPAYNARSFIDNINFICNGFTVLNLRDVGLYQAMLDNIGSIQLSGNVGYILYGQSDIATRNARASGYTYEMPLSVDLLGNNILPMPLFGSSLVRLEVYWGAPSKILESDSPNPTYSISNVVLFYEEITLQDALVRRYMMDLKNSARFVFNNMAYESYSYAITTPNSTASINIQTRKRNIHSLVAFFRTASAISNPAVNDKMITYVNPSVISYQVKTGDSNGFYPKRPVLCAASNNTEPYRLFIDTLNTWNSFIESRLDISAGATNWATNQFVMCLPFTGSVRLPLSGLDLSQSNSEFTFEVNYGALPAGQPLTLQLFIFYNSQFYLYPNSSVGKLE